MQTFEFGRPDPDRLADILAAQTDEALTYVEVGATGQPRAPAGYRRERRAVTLGRGPGNFDRVATAVCSWDLHRRAGFRVAAGAPAAAPDVDVVVSVPLGVGFALACCRVVFTVDEPDRRGFAYGTLPRHAETGEEAFVVERGPDDAVRLVVTQFSRPRSRTGQLLWPAHRAAQAIATRRYLAAAVELGREVAGTGGAAGQ